METLSQSALGYEPYTAIGLDPVLSEAAQTLGLTENLHELEFNGYTVVPPEKVGDVLALMGDSVDNVPGIRGIGPKTATKLIQEHGDLESALAAAPAMKPSKLRDSLIEQADMARLSRVLVQLKEDCPLPMPPARAAHLRA